MLVRLIAVLLLLVTLPLAAQEALPALPPEQAERVLQLLRDDARREAFTRDLEALVAAGRDPALARDQAIQLTPGSIGSQVLTRLAEVARSLSGQFDTVMGVAGDLPLLWQRGLAAAADPVIQLRFTDATWWLLLMLGLALPAEWLIRRLLRRFCATLDAAAPPAGTRWVLLRRLPLVFARFLLDLVPIAGFGIVCYLTIGGVTGTDALPSSQLAMLMVGNAYMLARAVMALGRMFLSPRSAHLRLLPVGDATAAYLTGWLCRIVVVAVLGGVIAESALLVGLSAAAYTGVSRLVALVVHVMLGILALQNRAAVAAWIRPRDPGQRGIRPALRRRLAEIWHLLALIYLAALWVVWAFDLPGGFFGLLRVSLLTVLVITVARGLEAALRRGLRHCLKASAELAVKFPGLEGRANRYIPVLKSVISGLIAVLAGLALLEVWGVPALGWFATDRLGSRLIASLLSIGVTLVIALVVWEAINSALGRHLTRLSSDGQAARVARMRTLMPILRTTLLGSICVIAGLIVLSELGVNTAPLLAGAGVVGIAIGFGSQTLVRDVITGLFLLLEDSMQVGDVVQLGGLSGSVEALSVRTIRLRAFDGSVHLIPFSSVTTVTNMTRDYSFAVTDVLVGYGENIDQVGEVLKELVAEMRAEPRWGAVIRDDLELIGVERLAENGVMIRTRIRTEPIQRWNVAREFNRRIKNRFDTLGIEIPYPHQKLVIAGAAASPFASAAPVSVGAPTASAAPVPPQS